MICECKQPGCLKCEIAHGPPTRRNQLYWRKWGHRLDEVDLPPAADVPKREPRPRSASAPKIDPLACRFRLDVISQTDLFGHKCNCADKWLYGCSIYGMVTRENDRLEADMVCRDCERREVPISKPAETSAKVVAGGT